MKFFTRLWQKLLVSLLVTQFVGLIDALFTTPAISGWYKTLQKPDLNPPNWIFSPVWVTLFILMGLAFYLIWRQEQTTGHKNARAIFFLQLALNLLWSITFFGLHQPLLAFYVIILLWLAILINIFYFYNYSKTAAYLLIPYLAWVTFAAYLNYFLWILNI